MWVLEPEPGCPSALLGHMPQWNVILRAQIKEAPIGNNSDNKPPLAAANEISLMTMILWLRLFKNINLFEDHFLSPGLLWCIGG